MECDMLKTLAAKQPLPGVETDGPLRQPTLRPRCAISSKALLWKDIPVGHTSGRNHVRVAKCTLKIVAISAGIPFPHAA
jgi:hypothetical protein